MRKTGIRNLKNNLSRYLQYVINGEEVLVTKWGDAIANIIPVESSQELDQEREALVQLSDRGIVILPDKYESSQKLLRAKSTQRQPEIKGKTISQIVIESRR